MKKYKIGQNINLLRKGENSLSEEQIDNILYGLPRELKLMFSQKGIKVEAKKIDSTVHLSIPDNQGDSMSNSTNDPSKHN